tara:strand:- start:1448 stop:3049 length:1602 start_codon:yes stop_codon:yes gene_type:complete
MKILSSSFLIILSTLFLIGCNAVTGQATGVSEQDQIDEAVMYIEGKSNACSNEFYAGPMKDFEFKLSTNELKVRDWLNDCMSDYGTSGNWMPYITYSIFGTIVDDINLNFSYDKADIDSTIAYLETLPETSIPETTQFFSNPNNQTDQDILFANNYLDTATDDCIALLENSMNVAFSPKSDIEAFLDVCSAQKPIFGQWKISQKPFLLGWNIKMTHSPADIQDTIIYLSESVEQENDEPVLTKSYEVGANEVSNDDNQQQQNNLNFDLNNVENLYIGSNNWQYQRQNYTVDEQTALDECIQEIADAPGWLKVFYQDGRHSMQNVFDTCLSNNGFDNTPPNDSNNELEENEPEENDFTYEQIATVVENCENEMQELAFAQYMLEDGRTPAQAYFESCLAEEGISVENYNDWVEAQEPEPVIMDGPPQGEALENILSTCVNEAYSSSIAIRFRSANAAEEYLQTSFNDCLNNYNIFEEYSYSSYSFLLNQTPDDPDNNQEESDSEESIEDRVNELEQQFADLFEQLQEILESVEN